MKIIILAAGKGERLYPLTRNTPKPLLDMGHGKTLLEEQIERIQASGVIDEIVLVIGYLAEQIEAKLRYYQGQGIEFKTIYNPFYDISNNLISLWFAKEEMDGSFLVTNGDNIFATDVFGDFVRENSDGIFLALSQKDHYDDEDMKVTLRHRLVAQVSKQIKPQMACAESPGLLLVDGPQAVAIVKDELESLVRKRDHRHSFWLELLNSLAQKGVSVRAWEFDGNTKWQEVDVHSDVDKVKEILRLTID